MKKRAPFRKALADPNLLGRSMADESWDSWKILMIGSMGEPLTDIERPIWKALTGGREREPLDRADEIIVAAGRRAGKTETMATTGAYIAGCCDFSDVLVPGETGVLLIVAADVEQAIIVLDRVEAKLKISPVMKQLVDSRSRTQRQLRLTNGIVVQVKAPNFRRVRGTTLIGAIGDEAAHWAVEGSANPDSEICAALRPALATTGGMLMLISSPYAKRGDCTTCISATSALGVIQRSSWPKRQASNSIRRYLIL
jgi:hypothetical protein